MEPPPGERRRRILCLLVSVSNRAGDEGSRRFYNQGEGSVKTLILIRGLNMVSRHEIGAPAQRSKPMGKCPNFIFTQCV